MIYLQYRELRKHPARIEKDVTDNHDGEHRRHVHAHRERPRRHERVHLGPRVGLPDLNLVAHVVLARVAHVRVVDQSRGRGVRDPDVH